MAALVTHRAPVNIAVIKYWGKRDVELNLPLNGSISATLDMKDLCTTTTVVCNSAFHTTRMWINGSEVGMADHPRIFSVIKLARQYGTIPERVRLPLYIASRNNFPTAAGLASSASGLACLVSALGELFCISEDHQSILARRGSGSACRSLFGGWAEWVKGECADGSDSVARAVAPVEHWPDLCVIILVASSTAKAIGSTSGMQTSVHSSSLLSHRAAHVVPARLEGMRDAIKNRDFAAFAHLTMADSNQLHAVCLDTFPPCMYLNDTSGAVIQLVHWFNGMQPETHSKSQPRAAYTFDAGPNAVVFVPRQYALDFLAAVLQSFPPIRKSSSGEPGLALKTDHETVHEAVRLLLPRLPLEWVSLDDEGVTMPAQAVNAAHLCPGSEPESCAWVDHLLMRFPDSNMAQSHPSATGSPTTLPAATVHVPLAPSRGALQRIICTGLGPGPQTLGIDHALLSVDGTLATDQK